MAARRNANRIRGPQSALTDFLAANNISAQQIRDSYQQRNQLANPPAPTTTSVAPTNNLTAQEQDEIDQELAEIVAGAAEVDQPESSKKKRQRADEDDEEDDVKQSGSSKKRKSSSKNKKKKKKHADDDGSDDDLVGDLLGKQMYQKAPPNPGQLENCEICAKRFTVTAYSKTGPDGGLVCGPCGRELVKDGEQAAAKPAKATTGKGRRKVESNRLDGIVTSGAKPLQQLCIEKVADHHLDVEDLGDMPDALLTRLSEIFAKRRIIDPRTLRLFIRPELDTVAIHDCAKLEAEDYEQIFAVVPNIKSLVLRNACQFKDSVLEYMMDKATNLEHLKLYAANLITNDAWIKFFETQGHKLQSLQLEWLDASFTDDVVEALITHCTSLKRLKLKLCRQLTAASLPHLAKLNLEHLSLHFSTPVEAYDIEKLVLAIGSKLKTLSLENCPEINDTLIHKIRTTCGVLSKLRLTPLDSVTDAALQSLFGGNTDQPTVLPPLRYLDLNSARDVDNNNPDGPLDAPIGLADQSFKAFMQHSGSKIARLRIPSCRHVSNDALWESFIGTSKDPKTSAEYFPELQEIDCSFMPGVDTAVITGIFKSCPALKKVVAFGCFRIEDVKVPASVALIGVPRAQEAIEQFGDAFFDDSAMDSLNALSSVLPVAVEA